MKNKIDALILGVNKILGWVQIVAHGCRYTCPTKEIDGKLCFRFKNSWHVVEDHVGELTTMLVEEEGKVFTKRYRS